MPARWSRRSTRAGLRVEADLRNEKINYKVREHSLAKVPVILVVGTQGGGGAHGLDPPPRITGAKVARIGAGARRSRGRGAAARPAPPSARGRGPPRGASRPRRPSRHRANDRLTRPPSGDAAPSHGQRRHSRSTSAAVRPMSLSCSSLKRPRSRRCRLRATQAFSHRPKAGSAPAFRERAGAASRRVKIVSIEPSVMRITGSEDWA